VKIGVDQYTYHRFFGEIYGAHSDAGIRWDLANFLDHIMTLPVESVSFESCFLPKDDQYLVDLLSNYEIPGISFAWGHPNGFMDTPADEVEREIERFLNLSRFFNTNVLRVVGSGIQYYHLPHRPQIELTVKRLKQLVLVARDYGIKLALENHGDFYLSELSEIMGRVNSPYLGLTLDTGNFLRFQENPIDAVRTFGTQILLVHAKDLDRLPGSQPKDPLGFGCVPPGLGLIDLPALLVELGKFLYTGAILIEISGVHPKFSSMSEADMVKTGLSYLFHLRNQLKIYDES